MTDPTAVSATVRDHDVSTRSGSVLLDDGSLLPYAADAFDAGGLRRLRSGQRVRLRLDVTGAVAAITLPTFRLP